MVKDSLNKLKENLQKEYFKPLDSICKWVDEGEILLQENSNMILDSQKIDNSLENIEKNICQLEVKNFILNFMTKLKFRISLKAIRKKEKYSIAF